ncbi:MAG: right-handed parallel beta-helix repeat-containing protein, partial [Kiritimatiellia bacterium]
LDLAKAGSAGKGVSIRGRGNEPVVIRGALRVTESENISFKRLNFADGVTLKNSKDITFNNCRLMGKGTALDAKGVEGLRLTHCLFTGFEKAAVELKGCKGAYLSGNIYDNASGPALRLDGTKAMLYSGYNSFRDAGTAWEIGGKTISLGEMQKGHEKYSRALTPEVKMAGGIPELGNQEKFTAGGPNGTALGVYREYKEKTVKVSAPVLHSGTPTTANLEWWTSLPARCELGWGETPECTNTIQFNSDGFCSFSLTGLKPRTTYYFKVFSARPLSNPGDYFDIETAMEMPSAGRQSEARPESILKFKTAKAMLDPVIYYVAPDGDDRSSGLSRDKAWRTVTYAADKVNAGDTVMIAGGTYKETVHVRATGLPDRPITFKSIPGEKVIFDGDNKKLARAFMASGKHHLRFDGLYFRLFSPGTRTSGIFCLYQCNSAQVTRCFGDGRHGYSPSFVMAWGCGDLALRNCAIISATYGNLYMVKCPGALVENNILLRSLIMEAVLVNEPDQKINLKKNIITDNVPHKVMVALLEVACMSSLVEENNCYYFRIPKEKRKLYTFYDPVAYERTVAAYDLKPVDTSLLFTNLVQFTLAEYQQKSGHTNSFVANPGFKATVDMNTADKDGKPVFLVDQLLGKKDLDFPDLFATDPEVVRRGIGLQPEAFKEFRFNAKP